MDHNVRHIIEDLLPLYTEGLLSEETTKWLEAQIQGNKEYEDLLRMSREPLPIAEIPAAADYESMMKNINRKLSLYQMLFIAISFFLAIRTSILNESFGFVLWYTVLGLVTYLFYQEMKLVLFISLVPIFIWSLGDSIAQMMSGTSGGAALGSFLVQSLFGAGLMALIHGLFAVIGALIGLLVLKIRKEGEAG
ncbi:hypothetical protein [Paenibacillus sp. FJAT-26967]|uniref:hypothetical protein n=1 Tax=Paenibacillus sp. FJAT-26967 TaxID=1729690 RepID=UPI000ADAB831|nr:hypothetical protein [Paenibacillus sp. FJAT-26967]